MSRKTVGVPEDQELLDKEARCLHLHSKGVHWADIATQEGYSNASGAYKAAQRALKRYPAQVTDEARALQNHQLDDLISQSWLIYEQALGEGDMDTALKAQDRIGKWLDRRAKLNGLDAPVKSEVDVKGAAGFPIIANPNRLPLKAMEALEQERAQQEQEQQEEE